MALKFKLRNNLRQSIEFTNGTSLPPLQWIEVSELTKQQTNLVKRGHLRCITLPTPQPVKKGGTK